MIKMYPVYNSASLHLLVNSLRSPQRASNFFKREEKKSICHKSFSFLSHILYSAAFGLIPPLFHLAAEAREPCLWQ